MGRKPRIYFPGAFYHVINRGNQRSKIYWDTADYEQMLRKLQEASERYQLLAHAYCLMPNHFHLLVEVGEHPLELAMKWPMPQCISSFIRQSKWPGFSGCRLQQ